MRDRTSPIDAGGARVSKELPNRPSREDRRSERAKGYRKWYWTARWKGIRAQQLRREPLCRMCRQAGRLTEATVCDHVEPHGGDERKFWAGPFQSLCKPCHDSPKQREESIGQEIGCDADGYPRRPC